ncbi:RING-H2 finger protein ATL66-like [Cornus florida]|uniref:RING-H2 finger protein ATL66-like n=1 Tax=Cornus florida TaxID=4283 RepID=UPI00289FC4D2|nr:RING-H2 finger protein ATL66-like [Cornus florida]
MEKLVDFNEETATINGRSTAIIVFAAILIMSLLHLHAKDLSSLLVTMFHHHYNPDGTVTEVVEGEREKDDDSPEVECVVCLSQVSGGEMYRILPECHHGFHVHCIDAWLQAHSTCPLCRSPVNTLSSHHRNNGHFYDGVVSCLLSAFDHICQWMQSPLNFELTSALCENSNYLC